MKNKQSICVAACLLLTMLLGGCGSTAASGDAGGDAVSAVMVDTWAAISDKIGEDNLSATMELTADNIKELYGLDAADLKQVVAYMPMINVKAEEFFLAEVAEGKLDTVVAGIEARRKALDEQWKQYLPDQYEVVKNYKLVQNGNYVLFAVSEFAEDAVTIFDAQTK